MSNDARLPSISDVAKACGLSTTTISRVLNGRADVSPDTRALISETISRLGYVPSAAARRMGSAQPREKIPTQTIAVICSRSMLKSVYGAELLAALSDRSAGTGYRLAVELDAGPRLAHYDGLLLSEAAGEIEAAGVPRVTVGWLSQDPLVPGVMPDWESGAYAAVTSALAKGYRHPFLLTGSGTGDAHGFDALMFRGVERALREHDLGTAGLVAPESVHTKDQGYAVAASILRRDDRPDLVISNDEAALGVYRAAREQGLCIPRDLGVIGCDGVSLCAFMDPPLSTIGVDIDTLAHEALQRLLPAINRAAGAAPQRLVMPVRYVERQSTSKEIPCRSQP
jgi:DNA-binding LacI/PurR family transcriptional regulator